MVTLGPRTAIWLAVALVASLAVNLFIAGIFAGRYFSGATTSAVVAERRQETARPRAQRGLPRVIRRMAERLPPEHRRTFFSTIQEHRPAIREAALALQRARLAVRDEVVREELDGEKLGRALEQLRTRNIAVQKALHEAVADAVGRLPSDARRTIADFNRPRRNQ